LPVVIGVGYAFIYYFSFRWVIRRWNPGMPGREEEGEESTVVADTSA
jgi:phosphotransferase system  glucose/maltose/N-acetylglucosamine-specific IIC component